MLVKGREQESNTTKPDSSTPNQRSEYACRGNQKAKLHTNSLPPVGYLYKQTLDLSSLTDPKDLGLTVLQARRKGTLSLFSSPQQYATNIAKKRAQMRAKKQYQLETDATMWGHTITTSELWPKFNMNGHLRLLFYNVNGISYRDNYFEMDMIMQMGGQEQADIILLTEINLNLHKSSVRAKVRDSIKAYDKYAKIQMAYSPDAPHSISNFNMGGNMAIVQGGLSGRCADQGADIYGRWSWITLKGSENNLVILCCYKVCRNGGTPGGTSVAQQEVRSMLKRDHRLANTPRAAFDADLADFCIRVQNGGDDMVVMMDANTPLDSAEARTFHRAANLYSVAEYLFPNENLPRTHQNGSRCIDHCLVTKPLLPWIQRFGYFPFYTHSLYDHRGMVLDIRCKDLFGKFRVDETRKVSRKLRSSNPKDSAVYRSTLKRLLNAAGIFNKVTALCKNFGTVQPLERKRRWIHLQKYNAVTKELMIAAENKLKPKNATVEFWSPVLKKKGQELHYYNERIRADEEYGDLGISVRIPAGITIDHTISSTEDLHNKQFEVKNSWRTANNRSEALRKEYLLDRAERAHELRDISTTAALKQIINAETAKALHKRHGAVLKDKHPGCLKKILVPFPDTSVMAPLTDKKCDVWREIDDDKVINDLFLHLNKNKLLMSSGRDFAPGGFLHTLVGPDGCSSTADSILDGTFDASYLRDENRHNAETLITLISHMARPKNHKGQKVPDMKWTYGKKEYRESFSKKNDDTSCGPSGLHMAHWIAACEDDDLCQLHAQFIEASFRIGLPYDRWRVSYHAMIQKKGKAWANAMRIVQLLEGDYNAGLRYLVQRLGVEYAEANNLYSGSTYGGRKGKNTHQVLGRIQATNEYCRLARTPAALADVDAVNCFDCMTHSGIGFFQRRQGSPKDLVRTQCNTLMTTRHHIKTGLGVSTNTIQHTSTDKPQGSGQGGGASVGNWQSHNDPMILAFQDLCHGCTMLTPDQQERLRQWMVSFVDDNKILMNFKPDTPISTIYNAMKKGVATWKEILNITGGDLELEKTWIGMLLFDFNTYSGKSMGRNSLYRAGVPKLIDSTTMPQSIVMQDGTIFRELKPNQGLRLLGVRMALSGSFQDEFDYRITQIKRLAGRMKAAAFDARDVWLIYQTRYRPMIRYCLPITTFTDTQCNKIQSPFICAFLNKLGMNKHTPRVVVWGPRKYGGLDIMNISTEQLSAHVQLLINNIRKNNETGKSMLLAMGMYQLTLGCARPFWDLDQEFYPTQSPTHLSMQYLWSKLNEIGATMHLPGMWTPKTKHKGDSAIMDDFVAIARKRRGTVSTIRPMQIELANSCRLFLQVTWFSEITINNGKRIAPWAYFGRRRNHMTAITYPHQPRPPAHAWKEWRHLLLAAYVAAAGIDLSREVIPTHERGIAPLPTVKMTNRWPPSQSNLSLDDIFKGMPQAWTQALGSVTIPDDEGWDIANILRTGGTIHCWSDGSVANGVGAHAYAIQTNCKGDDNCITGDAVTPGHPDTISSLRSEHYGAMAILLVILAIEWKYSIRHTGFILLHIDNTEVVNRIKYGVDNRMAADKHSKTDFDVWYESHIITSTLNSTVCAKWVKGHQDKYLQEKQGGVGPMPKEAHFNILVDRQAEQRRELSSITFPTIPMPTDAASLVIKGYFVTTKIDEHIRLMMTANPLIEYIQQKNNWSNDTVNLVNWTAIAGLMQRLSASKRVKVAKLHHNWQNTGRQKGLFLRSGGNFEDAEEAELCPMGCGKYEDTLHYLHCTKNPKPNEMVRGLKGIKRWMKSNMTEPGLTSIILRIARKVLDNQTADLEHWIFEKDSTKRIEFEKLVEEQQQIGWMEIFKGRLTTRWTTIQRQYMRQEIDDYPTPSYRTAEWWTIGLIQQLIYFTLNTWQIRNDHLHREKEIQEAMKRRVLLQEEMLSWYNRAPTLGCIFDKYFRIPFLQRKTYPTKQIHSWLETVKAQYGYAERKKSENGSTILDFFGGGGPSKGGTG
jgi:hypothetical protein